MTAVSPVGDQIAGGATYEARAGGVVQVCFGVVETADQGHPGGGSRANVEWDSGTFELRRFLIEWMIGFVTPVEGAELLFGQAADQVRVLEDDVSPEHHSLVAA